MNEKFEQPDEITNLTEYRKTHPRPPHAWYSFLAKIVPFPQLNNPEQPKPPEDAA